MNSVKMDFDLDDPLGDLLSDGSDDSLFNTKTKTKPILKNSSKETLAPTSKPSTVTIAYQEPTKKKMENLFGIDDDVKPTTSTSQIGFSRGAIEKQPSVESLKKQSSSDAEGDTVTKPPFSRSRSATELIKDVPMKQADNRDNDLIADLGFDPKKPKAKKISILDDLLESPPPKPKEIPKNLTGQRPRTAATISDSQTVGPETTYSPLLRPRTAGPRRRSVTDNDPLGLSEVSKKKTESQPSGLKKSSPIDWLGFGDSSEKNTNMPIEVEKPKSQPVPPVVEVTASEPQVASIPSQMVGDFPSKLNALNNINILNENLMQNVQQQEVYLMMAKQMKSQETALMEMQKKQQAVLLQQEANFNNLMQKQLQRQMVLEQNIKGQQERLNAHIQLLMTQPMATYTSLPNPEKQLTEVDDDHANNNNEHEMKGVEMEADIKRLELEKLRLEDTLQTITSSHEQEINMLETSYKKQIKLLEESMESIEQRLRTENDEVQSFYKIKLEFMEKEKQSLIDDYESKLKTIVINHEQLVKKLKDNYDNEIKDLQQEYKTTVENIRHSKMIEFAVTQENGTYIQTLKSASLYLENASGNLESLKDNLNEKLDKIHQEKQRELDAREKKLDDQQRLLDRASESAENERSTLIQLVKTLETKLNTISQTSAEEMWSLKQQRASLEAEKIAFTKEKEFFREKCEHEEKRITQMKDDIDLEYKRKAAAIEDEKQKLIIEAAKLQTTARLSENSQRSASNVEVETAIKVAQDATRQADLERERLMAVQRQFELRKRELIDQESTLHSKQMELESALSAVAAREREADNAIKSARAMEVKLNNQIQIFQKQLRELTEREAKVSQDKLEISKERLELQKLKKKVFDNRCSLCKIGERSQELSNLITKEDTHRGLESNPSSNPQFVSNNGLPFNSNNVEQFLNRNTELLNIGNNFEINLEDIPNLTDTADGFLDTDLLLLKFDVLNSKHSQS